MTAVQRGPLHRLLVILAGVALTSVVAFAASSAARVLASAGAPSALQKRAQSIAAEAYVYGSALLYEQRVIVNFPANHLINVTELSTPAQRLVPLPNVDTLYTVARLTLQGGPLIVHVPEERGRYYTLQLMDAYTNTFGYIGRRVSGTHPGNFAILGPGWRGRLPAGVKPIRSPTPVVWTLGRTLTRAGSDLSNANAIQRGYTLTPLSGFPGPASQALFLPRSALKPAPLPAGLAFYDAIDAAMRESPPPRSQAKLLRRFASIGIAPGRSVSAQHPAPAIAKGLAAGLREGRGQIERFARRLKLLSERLHNGWLVPPKATGNAGSDYLLRAYIASTVLGANVPAEAVYPLAFVDSALRGLSGKHRYVLHFSAGELPPVNAFWSLTMYGKDLFLVANPLDRYAIGDRTPGLRRNRDGSLDVLLASSAPRRRRSNWLPAPAGPFVLALRLYQPKAAVLTGSWPLPRIMRVG